MLGLLSVCCSLCNIHSVVCPTVREDYLQVLQSGLSPVQVNGQPCFFLFDYTLYVPSTIFQLNRDRDYIDIDIDIEDLFNVEYDKHQTQAL